MVKNLIKNGVSLLTLRQTDILSAATVIMLMSFASAVLGLVRDRLLAQYFTADLVGIYFASFRLPDFAFQVLVLGALSVAFIPVFTEYWQKDKDEAWRLAASLLNLAVVAFLLIVAVFLIFTGPLSALIVPGLAKENPAHAALLVNLTRIILLAQVFFVFSTFLTGVLQSFQRFLFPALAAVFYNLGIIVGIVFFADMGMYGVAFGVILGAVMHFLVQLPLSISLGFRPRLSFDYSHPGVRAIGRIMLPRSLALAANQINLIINTSLASLISLASITFLSFAQHLALVPINFFGAAISQAAFPTLSVAKSKNKTDEFKRILLASLHQILFLIIPASTALFVLHEPFTRLVFGARLFTWEATLLTGQTLATLSLSLAPQGAAFLLMRGFYALQDTRTPLKLGLLAIFANMVLSATFVLILKWPVWSLGISASTAAFINFFSLLFFLNRRLGGFERTQLLAPILKMVTAALVMALFLWVPMRVFDQLFFDTSRTINLMIVVGIASFSGLASYLFLAWLLDIKEAKDFLILLRRIGNWRRILSQSEEIIEPTA
ncbi:MAG: murein biosynthesis integral membrane protein MurJ [bacterium]|nr:murein biosynthesis integral membrane protein MurJ [bacterium]